MKAGAALYSAELRHVMSQSGRRCAFFLCLSPKSYSMRSSPTADSCVSCVYCSNLVHDIRSSRLVIHVDIPANSTDLRRSNSACRYSEFFPYDQINFDRAIQMHEIEHSLRLDRRTRGILIDVEVRGECAHKSVDVPFHQCHDKVEIAGHARLAVIPKRK